MDRLPGQPQGVNLAAGSCLVEDPDEEIFLLYVRKQATISPRVATAPLPTSAPTSGRPTSPRSSKEQPALDGSAGGLGFVSTNRDLLEVELKIVRPLSFAGDASAVKVRKGKGRASTAKEVLVRVQVQQSLDALRNKKGDTGSVLWRVSLHLARYLLTHHHFPSSLAPPLLSQLATSRVLELGSGTGFLGIALRGIVRDWIFTDQLGSLSLVRKNLERNGVVDAELEEVDWLVEGAPSAKKALPRTQDEDAESKPDVIIAADCIYNPSLSAPLARTIDSLAGKGTLALVASELRDEDPLEVFLREWWNLGWTIVRPELGEEGVGGREFVVWVGWKAGGATSS